MAANLGTHVPIVQVQNKANTTPFTYANPEKAGQSFFAGTPLMLNAGYSQAWDGTNASLIVGVAESNGLNLGSDGLGAPAFPWGGITGTGAIQTYPPTPPFQPLAVNIALGTPVSDGRSLFVSPGQDNVFEAMFDNTAGAVAADYTPVQSDVGKSYGLTKDSVGAYWFVDKSKVTVGTNTTVTILGINPVDGSTVNARVRFVFNPTNIVPNF